MEPIEHALPQNKMATEPVGRLMLTMGVPMILSMALQAFYNIVDSYFVSAMPDGEYGMNALTLAFPIQMLMIAIGVGTGVGINALLSKNLGQGNREKASKIAGNAIFLGLCTYAVFLLIGLFGVRFYLRTQTTDTIILDMGTGYLSICTTLAGGAILFMIYEKLLQATGRTMLSTIAQIVGAVTNIVLDPIMIFGSFGVPPMGIRGAAYATVIGQGVSLVMGIIFHHGFNKDVDSRVQYLKPSTAIILEIYKIGIPAIVMQALMSFMTYSVNIIFGRVSSAVVTAYGVYYKIQQFVFFAAFGMNNALIPIVAFNYGLQNKRRLKNGIKYGMLYTLILMALGAVALQVFAVQLMGIFSLSAQTQYLCIRAVRIITLGYLCVGANIAFQGIFQALGNGVRSLMVSLIRLVVVALPLAWFFTTFTNAQDMVWWAFPIAEGCAFILAILFMKSVAREKITTIK
ncbi:MAG: MATE family efflux transporter [Treponema sp.]|jgi:putative MATE family efflux protein|nr:MATE family efflux transporter [Treponema sp.]